jgi:hypothetical protein
VRVRRLAAVAVATLLGIAGLAGCRTNVGVAAIVGSHHITESDVNGYITPKGVDPSVAANAAGQGQIVSPRSQVLQYLIQEQVFQQTLASFGPVPSAGRLAAMHDAAASTLLQTQLAGDALDKAVRTGLPTSGISAKFTATFLRVQELEYAIITAKRLQQLPELLALIKKAHVRVSVSARYGTWDPAKLGLDAKVPVPSYLKVQPGPGAATPAGTTAPAN